MLYFGLIDNMKMADTAVPCSQFNTVFKILQQKNSTNGTSPIEEQYQVYNNKIQNMFSNNYPKRKNILSRSCSVIVIQVSANNRVSLVKV